MSRRRSEVSNDASTFDQYSVALPGAPAVPFYFGKYWRPLRTLELNFGSLYETGCLAALPDLRVPTGATLRAEGGARAASASRSLYSVLESGDVATEILWRRCSTPREALLRCELPRTESLRRTPPPSPVATNSKSGIVVANAVGFLVAALAAAAVVGKKLPPVREFRLDSRP